MAIQLICNTIIFHLKRREEAGCISLYARDEDVVAIIRIYGEDKEDVNKIKKEIEKGLK